MSGRPVTLQRAIYDALLHAGRPLTAVEIAKRIKRCPTNTRAAIRALRDAGILEAFDDDAGDRHWLVVRPFTDVSDRWPLSDAEVALIRKSIALGGELWRASIARLNARWEAAIGNLSGLNAPRRGAS